MVFSSITFLFVFLPIFLIVFHILKPKLQLAFLLFSSLLFYFWGENFLIWILIGSTTIDYFCSLLIEKDKIKQTEESKHTKIQKIGLIISILSNLCFLGYFKYYNFFIENITVLIQNLGLEALMSEQTTKVILPLGISFYTFQSMSYTIDVYRGKVKASKSFIKFASYVTMFPQLVAGPIVRYSDIESQMQKHTTTIDNFVDGIKRFIIGLAKKVLIANTMAIVADKVFELPFNELSTGVAWLGVIAYSLQIYYDFSGYSCMAIGLGKMIGFTFPENFNYPYISTSVREFWRRWHISLSTWFRDYLYFPLGGSKKGNLKTYRNLIIVFIICGFWHGATWSFIFWGIYHGLFLVLERLSFFKPLKKTPKSIQHIYLLVVVSIGWVFFRTDTLSEGIQYILVLLGKNTTPFQWNIIKELVQYNTLFYMLIGIVFSMPIFPYAYKKTNSLSIKLKNILDVSYLLVIVLVFIYCTMTLASGTYNPFIYFRF